MLQADSLLSRLKALKERIDATEAHVTLDLDHRRNQIVSFNLVVSIATISITWVSMTASVMGQNLYFNVAQTDIV